MQKLNKPSTFIFLPVLRDSSPATYWTYPFQIIIFKLPLNLATKYPQKVDTREATVMFSPLQVSHFSCFQLISQRSLQKKKFPPRESLDKCPTPRSLELEPPSTLATLSTSRWSFRVPAKEHSYQYPQFSHPIITKGKSISHLVILRIFDLELCLCISSQIHY